MSTSVRLGFVPSICRLVRHDGVYNMLIARGDVANALAEFCKFVGIKTVVV